MILDRRLQGYPNLVEQCLGTRLEVEHVDELAGLVISTVHETAEVGQCISQDLLAMQYTWTIAVAGEHGYVSTVRSLSFFHWISLLLYDSSI